jgi:hypothetical protein
MAKVVGLAWEIEQRPISGYWRQKDESGCRPQLKNRSDLPPINLVFTKWVPVSKKDKQYAGQATVGPHLSRLDFITACETGWPDMPKHQQFSMGRSKALTRQRPTPSLPFY